MRQTVKDIFFDFSAQREGFTPFMYADTLNLVTTGIGNLIDHGPRNGFDISANAMASAMSLPWKFKGVGWTSKNPVTTDRANEAEIREAWIRTKLQEEQFPGFNKKGGFAYAGLTPLTLDLDGIKNLFNTTLASFDKSLSAAHRFPNYGTWPADAQLALLSMSWAMGPAFADKSFVEFKKAANLQDFASAATHSFFKGGGGTPDKRAGRNAENVIMFTNADKALKGGVDLDRLFFPGTTPPPSRVLPTSGGGIARNAPSVVVTTAVVGGVSYGIFRFLKWKGWL